MLRLDNDECLILLQLLLRQSITGYALIGQDGKFWYANPAFCKMLEYTESELLNKKFKDITDPQDIEAEEQMSKMVADGEYETYDMTKSYITKTKKNLPVLLRVTGLRKSGKFICSVSEIAALEKPDHAEESDIEAKTRRILFFRTIKDYWSQITATLMVVAYIIAYIKGIKIPVSGG